MSHPYETYIRDFSRLVKGAKSLSQGGFQSCRKPDVPRDAPQALVFSPHPDDESIVGALPLRLLREGGHRVAVVSVTQGSNVQRQAPRLEEQKGACGFLGFELIPTIPGGLTSINPKSREANPAAWAASVAVIKGILEARKPRVVFMPHALDRNTTHQGTHYLVMDALAAMGESFSCLVVETEFWGAMDTPNLMVEAPEQVLADLVAAISFHVGEVARNPYHVLLPAWMADNVRRGGELVGGQGGAAPDYLFATLYRLSRWTGRGLEKVLDKGTQLPAGQGLGVLTA